MWILGSRGGFSSGRSSGRTGGFSGGGGSFGGGRKFEAILNDNKVNVQDTKEKY